MRRLDLLVDGKHWVVETGPGTCVIGGRQCTVDSVDLGRGGQSVIIDGIQHTVHVVAQQSGSCDVAVDGKTVAVHVQDPRSLQGRSTSARSGGPREVRSPMPGKILAVHVSRHDHVERGQALVVVEAMKMQNELRAPREGTVRAVNVRHGDSVSSGDVLVVVA